MSANVKKQPISQEYFESKMLEFYDDCNVTREQAMKIFALCKDMIPLMLLGTPETVARVCYREVARSCRGRFNAVRTLVSSP